MNRHLFRRWAPILALSVLMSGCALLPSNEEAADLEASKTAEPAIPELTTESGYRFRLVAAPAEPAEGEAKPLRSAVVVMRNDREVQRIEHDFGMPPSEVDPQDWLTLSDADDDGHVDLLLTRRAEGEGAGWLDALYRFDANDEKFVRVDDLSDKGRLEVLIAGCVSVEPARENTASASQEFCYSPQAGRWIRQLTLPALSVAAQKGPEQNGESAACLGSSPDLNACRKLRMSTDKALKTAMIEHKNTQRPNLQRERGRQYAQRFAVNLDASHRSWLQYRDNRCQVYVREQGLQAPLFHAVNEACRFRLAQWQLQQYRVE
ncbi:MAG: hypothetical protein MUF76_13455 [Hydrogenophaga sp.]|nr:hypothetical protein [Hydrogenophaga sp.]